MTLCESQTFFVRVNASKQCFLGDITKIPRTSSTGTMSSNEDADEKDGNVNSFESEVKSKCLLMLHRGADVDVALLDVTPPVFRHQRHGSRRGGLHQTLPEHRPVQGGPDPPAQEASHAFEVPRV